MINLKQTPELVAQEAKQIFERKFLTDNISSYRKLCSMEVRELAIILLENMQSTCPANIKVLVFNDNIDDYEHIYKRNPNDYALSSALEILKSEK